MWYDVLLVLDVVRLSFDTMGTAQVGKQSVQSDLMLFRKRFFFVVRYFISIHIFSCASLR